MATEITEHRESEVCCEGGKGGKEATNVYTLPCSQFLASAGGERGRGEREREKKVICLGRTLGSLLKSPEKMLSLKERRLAPPQLCMGMLSDDWVRENGPPGKTKKRKKRLRLHGEPGWLDPGTGRGSLKWNVDTAHKHRSASEEVFAISSQSAAECLP